MSGDRNVRRRVSDALCVTLSPAPSSLITPRAGADRQEWIDAAKGLCMVLVVVMHVTTWFDGQVSATTTWQYVTDFLAPVRMPLFFAISGLLAASALRRSFGGGARRKAAVLAFVYALWTSLIIARQVLPVARADGDRAPTFWDLLTALVVPTSLWYLWALAGFYLLAWTAHRILGQYRAWLLLPLVVLAVAGPHLAAALGEAVAPADPVTLGWAASNLVWFYAGTVGRPALVWLQARRSRRVLLAAVGAYIVIFCAATLIGAAAQATTVLAGTGLVAAGMSSALLPTSSRMVAALRWVGQGTLAVYVMHFLAISAMSALVKLSGAALLFQASPRLWGVIIPPLVAAVIVVGCRTVGGVVLRSPLAWTLTGPKMLRV